MVFLDYITRAHAIQLLCDFEFEEHELTQFNYFVNKSGEPETSDNFNNYKGKPFVVMLCLIIYWFLIIILIYLNILIL